MLLPWMYHKLYEQTFKLFPFSHFYKKKKAITEKLCTYVILHICKYDKFPEEEPLI